jgi:hypothetical protein
MGGDTDKGGRTVSYYIVCGGWGNIGFGSGYTYELIEAEDMGGWTRRMVVYRGSYEACAEEMREREAAGRAE